MIGPTNALTVTGTVDPGSVTVGSDLKPVKLVNGVATAVANDLVDTASAQTIGGTKIFANDVTFTDNRIRMASDYDRYITIRKANNTTDTHQIAFFNNGLMGLYPGRESGKIKAVVIDGQRTYDATHLTDIVTIGTLQASTDVVHRSGDETVNGTKTFEYVIHKEFVTKDSATVGANTWRRLYNIATSSSGSNRHVTIEMPSTRNTSCAILDIMWGGLTGSPWATVMHRGAPIEIRVCRATDGHLEVWTNDHVYGYVTFEGIRTAGQVNIVTASLSTADTTEPVVGDTYSAVVTPEVI